MKYIRRIVTGLLAAVLLLPVISARAASDAEKMAALEAAVIESCYYGTTIDITQYDVTLEQLNDLYYALHDAGKLAWYAEYRYFRYTTDPDTGNVLTFEPKLLPPSRYDRAVYQQKLEEILRECVLPGMEDWQIALALHDYLIIHAAYDESLNERYGYELLTKGQAVCAGYTEVYRELLNLAGVPCVSVASDPMNHIWNLVQIGGNWYHVDVTWDDPAPDSYGYVGHKYFLVTDEQISAGDDPHYDWVTDIECTDTTFTDAFFRDVESAICFADADTCYLIREKKYQNHLYRHAISTGKETVVYKEKDVYANVGKGNYYYRHFGISLWDGRLWMNTLTKVISMKPDGTDVRTEFTYNAKKNKRFILGCYVDKDTIRYTTSEHTGYYEQRKEVLEPTGYHVHSYTQTVTPPDCETPGYTESVCSCGIACKSTPVAALGHQWQRTEEKAPTLFAPGSCTEMCSHCTQTLTYPLEKQSLTVWLQEHSSVIALVSGGVVLLVVLLARKKTKKTDPVIME